MNAFRACLDSGKHVKEVEASVDRIAKMNVSGTPMFFVARTSGDKVTIAKIVEGAQPFEAFKTAVEEVSKGKSSRRQIVRRRRVPGRNGVDVICPSNAAPHRPGIAVPQSGHAPSLVTL